jgi:choice-of-anchor A domain-containing protein
MNKTNRVGFRNIFFSAALAAAVTLISFSGPLHGSMIGSVDLGTSGNFTLLALGGGIDDSGPTGPDANPYTVNRPVGVVTSGQKFQASASVTYAVPIDLHSGVTYNSSAPGVPQPTTGSSVDTMLEKAKADAFSASSFASGLAATATFGTINNTMSITENAAGNYVFNITAINFSGNKTLTLNAPSGSSYVLNISSGITLTGGSILVAGGLTAGNVLINYTGTNTVQFSGGGNTSRVDATILAPNAEVGLHPGFVAGSIIADSITMSSGADVSAIPEVTPSSVIFGFLGLIVAVSSRKMIAARAKR